MMKALSVRQMARGGRSFVHTSSAMTLGIVMVSVTLVANMVKADVLHDTSWMITDQTANTTNSAFIGGLGAFSDGMLRDVNLADDFNLAGNYNITSATGAFFLQDPSGGQLPAGGLLIEFFADTGAGSPQAQPAVQVLTQSFTATPFSEFGLGDTYYLTADLTNEDIQLGAGTWWMSITPVDESNDGGHWKWFRQNNFVDGATAHYRGGGEAHGNGYDGSIYGTFDWTPFGTIASPGDLAMTVEGTLIPAPASLVLLGFAGFLGRRGRQRAF